MRTELYSTFERIGNESNNSNLKQVVSQLWKPHPNFDRADLVDDHVQDVFDEPTVQMQSTIDDDKDNLEVLVLHAALAMHPVEHDRKPMKVHEHNDNDTETSP